MNKSNKGITLIALVITIIILLILAGVSIAMLAGNNGILNNADKATEETAKAQIKEEIELKIAEIQIDEGKKEQKLTLAKIKEQLPEKLDGLVADLGNNEIIGEYKGYFYIIDDKFIVTIGGKVAETDPVPQITYTLSTEQQDVREVIITINASIRNGSIVEITKPDGSKVENTQTTTYTVTKNGIYEFQAKSDKEKIQSCTVQIRNIIIAEPVINIIKGEYPSITQNGIVIQEGEKVISIDFDHNDQIENYYSEDQGTTWQKYEGEFTTTADKIKAKSMRNGINIVETEKEIKRAPDELAKESYDGNTSTFQANSGVCYLKVDDDAIGYTLNLYATQYYWRDHYIVFTDGQKNEIGERKTLANPTAWAYWTIKIPEGAKYFKIDNVAIGEITIVNQ